MGLVRGSLFMKSETYSKLGFLVRLFFAFAHIGAVCLGTVYCFSGNLVEGLLFFIWAAVIDNKLDLERLEKKVFYGK